MIRKLIINLDKNGLNKPTLELSKVTQEDSNTVDQLANIFIRIAPVGAEVMANLVIDGFIKKTIPAKTIERLSKYFDTGGIWEVAEEPAKEIAKFLFRCEFPRLVDNEDNPFPDYNKGIEYLIEHFREE